MAAAADTTATTGTLSGVGAVLGCQALCFLSGCVAGFMNRRITPESARGCLLGLSGESMLLMCGSGVMAAVGGVAAGATCSKRLREGPNTCIGGRPAGQSTRADQAGGEGALAWHTASAAASSNGGATNGEVFNPLRSLP